MSRPGHVRKTGGPRAIVLLHGIGAGAEMFAPQVDALGREHDAIGWNLPGYGGTELLAPMTFPGLSVALLAFLDGLGLEKVDLLGHSIGGMLAQDFIARHPERVRTLVLSATTAAFGSRDGEFQKRFVADLVGSAASPNAVPAAIAAMSEVPEATYREAIRCLATFDARETLGRIAVPTLLVAGEEDRNAPAPTMRRMAEKIAGARIIELAGIGHLAPLECADAYTAEIRAFLQETGDANASERGADR
jgi:3-oxoadipate enol-lactonase